MDYFKILPEEITLDILTRLPTESVLDSKLVCTNWRSIISDHPSFSKMHLYHLNHPSDSASDDYGKLGFLAFTYDTRHNKIFYYIEYNENRDESTTPIQRIRRIKFTPPIERIGFVGSCNGLICLVQGPFVWIWNPITKEYLMLPKIKRDCQIGRYRFWTTQFGYVSSTNEYKVLGIYKYETKYIKVYVYTLGSGNGWRKLGKFCFESRNYWAQFVFVDGALYWLDEELKRIITFDLAKEKFCEDISPPPLPPDHDWHDSRLRVLNGVLSFAICLDVEGDEFYDIWLLKKKDDSHDKKGKVENQSMGWSKGFRVGNSKLLAITKRNGVLAFVRDCLNIYGTITCTSKSLVKFKNCLLQVTPHKNTLVLLKELGEEDTKRMESVDIEEANEHDYPFKQPQEDASPEYVYL
ncbi:F-box protein At3g07870-like [Papaver somniferum]|uniref:F-box protein At3g07870-like n=1 Tax=Papaver somniferum TaxID=3469 RepID=UPI000E6F7DE6|nr:F-box protein At3g07870-like [Papaver somniferum]XP_026420813.1 F-box protein At3g07870-like [Papaver somniferum]